MNLRTKIEECDECDDTQICKYHHHKIRMKRKARRMQNKEYSDE